MCKTVTMSPKDLVLYWISQGVMLLNASLTRGTDCPKYLEDHSVAWEEVMHTILVTIYRTVDPVFVLIGKDTWKFENEGSKMIKVSNKDIVGSGVFSTVSRMMIENNDLPVKWIA